MKKNKSVVRAWNKEQARLSKRATFGVMLPLLLGVGAAIWQGWALAVFVAALLAHAATAHLQALWAFVGASVLRILLGIWQGEARLRAGQQARRRLRQSLLQRIQADGPALLRRQHSAALGTLLGERIEALDGYFGNWLPASSSWVLAQLLVIGAVLWANWRAGLVLLVFCGLMPIFQACFGIATARASRREFLAMARLQTRFLDRMRGIATIVLSGRIWSEARVMETASHDLRQRTMKVLRVAFLTSAATDFAMVGALVVIVVSQSRILLHHPAFSPLGLSQPEGQQVFQTASALFALFMVPEAFVPVRRLAAAYQDRAKGAAMAEAVEALGPLPVGADQPVGSGPVGPMSTGVVPVAEAWGISVAFKQVSYRWSPDRPEALQEISFVLPPGKTLILEGASGAGKTTLLELLIGFIQAQKGEVLLGGENIAHISPNDLTPLIAWIGQKPVLFSGSLKENILFGNPDAGEEEVQAALQAAGIASFLPLLPAGLETRVGEGGYGLSGGQAQRVAIARAWLKNAPLLVLDEPTSHLDPQTEQGIVKALEKLMQNRTVVLTTHSPAFRALPAALRGELSHGRLILDGLKREEREASL